MAVKDISDLQVVKAAEAFCQWNEANVAERAKNGEAMFHGFPLDPFAKRGNREDRWVYTWLMEWTGQPEKVCYRAMERAEKRELIDYGVSLRTCWPTEKGKELLLTEGQK